MFQPVYFMYFSAFKILLKMNNLNDTGHVVYISLPGTHWVILYKLFHFIGFHLLIWKTRILKWR